jgi:hypothetical protein
MALALRPLGVAARTLGLDAGTVVSLTIRGDPGGFSR